MVGLRGDSKSLKTPFLGGTALVGMDRDKARGVQESSRMRMALQAVPFAKKAPPGKRGSWEVRCSTGEKESRDSENETSEDWVEIQGTRCDWPYERRLSGHQSALREGVDGVGRVHEL